MKKSILNLGLDIVKVIVSNKPGKKSDKKEFFDDSRFTPEHPKFSLERFRELRKKVDEVAKTSHKNVFDIAEEIFDDPGDISIFERGIRYESINGGKKL